MRKEEEERLKEISLVKIEEERKIREEQRRTREDSIHFIKKILQEQNKINWLNLKKVAKLKERRIIDEQQSTGENR